MYRRSSVLDVALYRGGYLGIAEMIGKLALAGSRIIEYPTTLNQRVLGYSKMKVVRTVLGHVSLMFYVERLRWGLTREAPRARAAREDAARTGAGSVPGSTP